ncbi:DUF3726 domain-containing protein [Thalassococcus sp. CAU 1522]|uniref:DUF3726 domain-containing protein n=1 Tax=Thalassococcus arenae TaxID=2851652 RepID=A0ABS6N849_9RHOB|nr:DUF3726 domain-containing protein [Thalassococcus arenae]MBV2359769.1 DUF3726 domain-containing protein [Thalassococcus arenae]
MRLTLSLGEVEATARKAARGAGYDWAMADEAGRAVRWLHGAGCDGCAALARWLDRFDGTATADWAPQLRADGWHPVGDAICPFFAGVTLADHAGSLDTEPTHLRRVAEPLLILPFAAQAARKLARPVALTIDAQEVQTDGVGLAGSLTDIANATRVAVCLASPARDTEPPRTRAEPTATDWHRLEHFAGRTYAPATEESRRKGAGAGLTDND